MNQFNQIDRFQVRREEFDGPVLVTGASSCIGSWVLALLTHAGIPAVAFDLREDTRRTRLLLSDEQLAKVRWHVGDIADGEIVKLAVQASGARHHSSFRVQAGLWRGAIPEIRRCG